MRNAAADPATGKALAAWLSGITSDPDIPAARYGGRFHGTTIDPGVAGALLVELLIRGVLRDGLGRTLAREGSSRIGKSNAGHSLAAFPGPDSTVRCGLFGNRQPPATVAVGQVAPHLP